MKRALLILAALAALAIVLVAVGAFANILDFTIHLDSNLGLLIKDYGFWVYLILFGIIFIETGIVVFPFLPGDSLLFAAGAFVAIGSLDFALLFLLLSAAAIAGDTANYQMGYHAGPKAFDGRIRFLKKEHLDSARHFYEKHGKKTIVIARFIPIMRTFAPFVAGIGKMSYWRFISYNIIGGIAWVTVFLSGGYLFGNLPVVKDNFTTVILAIIILTLLPGMADFVHHYWKSRKGGAKKV